MLVTGISVRDLMIPEKTPQERLIYTAFLKPLMIFNETLVQKD